MRTQIVKGWTNGKEEYRVYVNQVVAIQFPTYQEAFLHVEKLKQMNIEKATIADDEDQSA